MVGLATWVVSRLGRSQLSSDPATGPAGVGWSERSIADMTPHPSGGPGGGCRRRPWDAIPAIPACPVPAGSPGGAVVGRQREYSLARRSGEMGDLAVPGNDADVIHRHGGSTRIVQVDQA